MTEAEAIRIHTPFVTAIGTKTLPEQYVQTARTWFSTNKFDVSNGNGFDTTLVQYYTNESVDVHGAGVDDFHTAIEAFATEYLQHGGYDTTKWVPKVHRVWLNSMPSGSVHRKHAHYGATLSGCFYATVPEGAGHITFFGPAQRDCKPVIPVDTYTVFNSDVWTMNPKEGEAYIWLSDLSHEVPSLIYEGLRQSIAFDIVLKEKHVL